MLGITNYDKCGGLDKLVFDMRESIDIWKKEWKTLDLDYIFKMVRLSIVRELQMIEERKDAEVFRKKYDE